MINSFTICSGRSNGESFGNRLATIKALRRSVVEVVSPIPASSYIEATVSAGSTGLGGKSGRISGVGIRSSQCAICNQGSIFGNSAGGGASNDRCVFRSCHSYGYGLINRLTIGGSSSNSESLGNCLATIEALCGSVVEVVSPVTTRSHIEATEGSGNACLCCESRGVSSIGI